jgi:hypothetical protein
MVAAFAFAPAASAHIPGTERVPSWNWTELYKQRPMADGAAKARAAATEAEPQPTPEVACGPGSNPAPDGGITGRVPADAVAAGKADNGFTCNATLVGREGSSGGFKVERFVDKAGHECAFYDTTLLFPTNPANSGSQPPAQGAAVLDMSNPAKPVRTTSLLTPAMQSPHESLLLNKKRGLLAAVAGNPATYPGIVDIYDVNADCRNPVLESSLPIGVLGHESGFAPDGNTFYATSLFTGTITAIDVSNPKLPIPIWEDTHISHGLTISDDGNRAYLAADFGLLILDVSQIQARKPNPQAPEISRLTWKRLSIPQVAQPVTIGGKPYLVEVDEFSTEGGRLPADNGSQVGAGRIIDISDEKQPRVVSNLRLGVHQEANRARIAGDPGASGLPQGYVQGYAGHYCTVPRRNDPGVVACSMIASGLRVFDIRDPENPREIAYYVAPFGKNGGPSNWAMSGPAFALERREIWYSDGNSGFYAVRIAEQQWPFDVKGLLKRGACTDTRSFTFRLHGGAHGARVVKVVAYVNGRRALSRRGRNLKRVTLARLPRKRFVVKIVTTLSDGSKRISTRTYRADCTKSAPRTVRRR